VLTAKRIRSCRRKVKTWSGGVGISVRIGIQATTLKLEALIQVFRVRRSVLEKTLAKERLGLPAGVAAAAELTLKMLRFVDPRVTSP
jgi:hypothetical protein